MSNIFRLPHTSAEHALLSKLFDTIVALHKRVQNWRKRKRTLRALNRLDERQLRDIGLTRDQYLIEHAFFVWDDHKSIRALAELDDSQLSNLSERGLQLRREIKRRRNVRSH